MSEQNMNNEEVKYEKLSDDELQVINGGAWKRQRRGPVPKLYSFKKGEKVVYIDDKGVSHPAEITLIEWQGWNPIMNIYLTDIYQNLKVHPASLRKESAPRL